GFFAFSLHFWFGFGLGGAFALSDFHRINHHSLFIGLYGLTFWCRDRLYKELREELAMALHATITLTTLLFEDHDFRSLRLSCHFYGHLGIFQCRLADKCFISTDHQDIRQIKDLTKTLGQFIDLYSVSCLNL